MSMIRKPLDIRFKYKLAIVFSLAFGLLVGFSSWMYYLIGADLIGRISSQYFSVINTATEKMVSGQLSELSWNFFTDYQASVLNDPGFVLDSANRAEKNLTVQRALTNISHFDSNTVYLQYLAPNGETFSSNNVYWQTKYLLKPQHDLKSEERELIRLHGRCTWESVDETCFCFKRALLSTKDMSYRGCIVAGINVNFFKAITQTQSAGSSDSFVLLDHNLNILYAGNGMVRAAVSEMLSQRDGTENYEMLFHTQEYGGQHYQIRGRFWSEMGLYFLSVINTSSIAGYTQQFFRQVAIFAVIAGAIAVILTMLFSSKWSKKIRSVVSSAKLEAGPDVLPGQPQKKDELTQLADAFSSMNDRLNSMMDQYAREKQRTQQAEYFLLESKYMALQLAMNPHSLYNMLESIYSLAVLDGNERIADMISLLGYYMRDNLRKTGKIESLGDEIDHVLEYLNLNKGILGDRLDYGCDVPDSLRAMEFPCMMVMPFVENVVEHGIGKKGEPGRVDIVARERSGRLCVEIRDDGVGIPPGEIADVLYGRVLKGNRKHVRIGISNVRERPQILFGESGSLELESTPGVGTVVRIIIPLAPHVEKGNIA